MLPDSYLPIRNLLYNRVLTGTTVNPLQPIGIDYGSKNAGIDTNLEH